jgi:putative membrane protein
MLDLTLAVAHHVLVFALAGILASELALVVRGMSAADLRRLTQIDVLYGAIAGVIVAVGCLRVLFAAKGWHYYAANHFFWAKMATFLAIGLLSLIPTVRYLRWQRTYREDGTLPPPGEVRAVQGVLWLEAALFAGLLAFAAAMARGYGL